MPKAFRQPIDGVLLLDKPVGLSSGQAMARARNLLQAAKAGHGGTLDPMASGLLPILLGEATKFADDLLQADKTYRARLRLGVTTDTEDATGQVLEERPVQADEERLREIMASMLGDSEQIPPMYSALKRDGRALYDYARAGQTLERAPRPIRIMRLDLHSIDWPEIEFEVHCGKGTYVRTLAADIGARMGCGAHLSALRRVGVGRLDITQAVTLEALQGLGNESRRSLLPVDALISGLPAVELHPDVGGRFAHGQRLRLAILPPGSVQLSDSVLADAPGPLRVRVLCAGRLLGIAELRQGLLAPIRLVAHRDERTSSRAASKAADPAVDPTVATMDRP